MSVKDNKMDGFLEPGISLALRMDQYPGLPSVDEDPNIPSLTERSRIPSLVEQDSGFLLNDDLRLPKIVEMEEFTRRFVRNNDRTQRQGFNTSDSNDSNATAETLFTYGTNDDNDDNNNDGDDYNSDENIGDEEPNNNNRYVYNRNMNVLTASVNQDHENDEELESEPSDLFCGTICNETFQQMNRSRERARMNGCYDDCWNPIEPLLTSSTLTATVNVTAASIKSPGSTLAGNITPSSLKNMQAISTSSWTVNHLHLLRTVSDIDTSIGEEDFKDCVEAISKQCNEEESVERDDVQGTSTADVDVVYLSDLSSCSSFGSCFDDMDRSKLVTDPETLSFETCFDQSGALKVSPIYHPNEKVQQKVKSTYDAHSSPKQTSTRRPSPASATDDYENDLENDLMKVSPSDQNSLLESFEMIKSPEIKKTIESMLYSSCRSDFVSMDQSESSLSKLDEARETLIQNFRGTKKQLRSRLSSLARWINSDSEEEYDANLAVKLKAEVTPQVNVTSEVKVTPPTVKLLSRVKRLEAVDLGNMDGDFGKEESFVVIHNSACKRSLPFEAEKQGHQMDCKRQISFESCRAFDRTNSQEGLLSDTESHIHDQLGRGVKKGNSTCSVM